MAVSTIPYLCGGILFNLLLEVGKNRRKARDSIKYGSDGLSNTAVLRKLIYVVTGEEARAAGSTFDKNTTQFRTCELNGNTYIPFEEVSTSTAFSAAAGRKNSDLLKRMSEFIGEFINSEKAEWLVKAIFDVISNDEEIGDETEFNISISESVCKKNLYDVRNVVLQPFLISVLNFILKNRQDNTKGRATFEAWYKQSAKNSPWRFVNTSLGTSFPECINVSLEYGCESADSVNRAMPLSNTPEVKKDANDVIAERMSGALNIFAQALKTNMDQIAYGSYDMEGKTAIILGADGVAPELSPDNCGNVLLVDRIPLDEESDDDIFDSYLEKATNFYSVIKTLLYSEKPREFYDFYVCNDLQFREYGFITKGSDVISNATIPTLSKQSNYSIIRGTGGIGKSMMMRHLFMDSVEAYEENGSLPVLCLLKNYNKKHSSLLEFVYRAVSEFDHSIELHHLEEKLSCGKCILLFDGLDEVLSDLRSDFDEALINLMKEYPDNTIVVSSRPTSNFVQMGPFQVFDILPFEKKQAIELIDKLNFYDSEAKAKFREDLDKKLYRTHQQFASNPLLLTIMLMTYTSYGEVPAKRHIFYAKAYETMARLHDASKGAYVRPMHTNLSPEDFAVFFAEFCARTYKKEVLEFTVQTFTAYMTESINHVNRGTLKTKATAKDFLKDLTDNLCIMYKEGEKYYFIHRSFQEYFCALFFSTRMDDKLEKIGAFFEAQQTRQYSDKTFDMLYDMIPERLDKYVFLPKLKSLWQQCDSQDGYWTFLEEIYPAIYHQEGNVGDCYETEPESFLYNFIVNETLNRHNGELDDIKWPDEISFYTHDEWVSVEKGKRIDASGKEYYLTDLCKYDGTRMEGVDFDEYDNPEIEGNSWEFDPYRIRKNPSVYEKLIVFMEDDAFPLMKEYNEMRQYTADLDARANSEPNSDDWFEDI